MTRTMHLTGDAAADELLASDANALLLGMLLDQQFPMERAFQGPAIIAERLGRLDVAEIAGMDPEAFTELCSRTPAVHRFPASMAQRIQSVCRVLVDEWGGSAANLFDAPTGAELKKRISSLPGFGDQKSKIMVALLAKQWGIAPTGWRQAAGDYSLDGFRSVADVVDDASLQKVRETKKAAKAAAKASE
ncbi:MAG TPA: HhH-GPD-type base excision DNA repair protein [Propioniciclava tarda]|nr:HhH-GPD-type base excision DNA repair protein [Propioniciclava tarda]HQA30049.1 HhH-GPD-type base excision DNA repair protein [Propioniciclava tarda]HQD59842.1 HhH-GPD-type base excision DNA repair protein [Propioniciclava tarda]